ncbi:serine hydrolase domain-containing protein [Fusicatenibacter sp.]
MEQILKERLQQVMDASVAKGETPGCLLLVIKDGEEQVYLESGYADIEAKTPVSRDHIFRLYSMSKPITAAAMMILVERGIVDLADPVSKYLPGFRNQIVRRADGHTEKPEHEVLLEDLMNMTSGLTYGGTNETGRLTDALFEEVIRGIEEGNGGTISTVEFANRLGKIPLLYQPGQSWSYGTSADVVGAVIEVASGMRFGDFLRKEIFEPLGMKDTDFWVPAEKQNRLTKVYDCKEGQPPVRYLDHNLGIQNDMAHRPAYEAGGAGLASTIDDYAKFAQMLLNGGTYNGVQILRPATAKFMGSHTLSAAQQAGFDSWIGLEGFSYGNLMRVLVDPTRAVTLGSRGEFGWDGWLGCYMEVVPEKNMTFLMMTQKKDAGTYTLSRKIRNIIFSE